MTSILWMSPFQMDPFRSVSQLSEQEKKTAGNQSVPSLLQLLDLAKTHNTSVIFDLKNDDNNDAIDTVNTILKSGIPQDLVSRMFISITALSFLSCVVKVLLQLYDSVFLSFLSLDPLASPQTQGGCEGGRTRVHTGLQQCD